MKATKFLGAFHGIAISIYSENNWVEEVRHAVECYQLESEGEGECNCKPLRKLIWNGEPDFREKVNQVLAAYEKLITGQAASEATQSDNSPPPRAIPMLPPIGSETDDHVFVVE